MTFKMIMPFFNAETDEGGNTGVDVTPEVEADIVPDAGEQEEVEQGVEIESEEDEEIPELPSEQKTAFQKRLEREQRKIREQLEQELKSQYSKHEQIVQMLGGDPDAIERAIQEQQLMSEAQQQAELRGWTQEETQFYIQQKRLEQELFDLRIKNEINELADNSDYAGVKTMRKEIADMVRRSGGVLTVEQAYWALGGKARAEQLKREAEQRAIAKRKQAKFSPQTDSSSASVPTSQFSAEELAAIKQMGLTVEEAQALMKTPSDLYEFRKQRKKK